jgi:hypothetical protein
MFSNVPRCRCVERVCAQSRRFLHRADSAPLDRVHVPHAAARRPHEGDVMLAQRQPRLTQSKCVVEVGERVKLDGLAVPLALDACAQVAGQTRRLTDITADDLLILIHCRDPLTVRTAKRPFRSVAAPERPDHDIESWTSRVLVVGRSRQKSPLQGALRPCARKRAGRLR